MRLILGIDPGSVVTGYGIIESNGIRSSHVASGTIRVAGEEFPRRLGDIFTRIGEVVERYRPVEMAIEQVFVNKNVQSALKLGQARGAAICACVVAGLPVAEYTPRMIKQAVVGHGNAGKEQVQQMVRHLLKLEHQLAADESDALAVALGHAHTRSTLQALQRSGGRRR
ncbi:MAG: crossover junction endodeoxyribonuclease RuvC [Candidatus Sedimenticola endophacoides]